MQQIECKRHAPTVLALAIAAVFGSPAALAEAPDAPATESKAEASQAAALEKVIVTGTRKAGTRLRDSAAPISVVSAAELAETGASNLFDAMTALVPSYNSQSVGGDIGNMIRSVQLRGLSPNHVLVLVNGKRRHNTASIAADNGPNQYTSPADLDLIPVSAVDHIEILQDGAAAQYGSDAIAGVVNIILKSSPSEGGLSLLIGQHGDSKVNPHREHQGLTRDLSINKGFALGKDGYLHLSAQVRDHDFTNQTGADLVTTRGFGTPLVPRSPSSEPFPSRISGDPKSRFANAGVNAGLRLGGGAEVYAIATAAHRDSESWQNWRTPEKAPAMYPMGFSPLETVKEDDYALTVGVKGVAASGWRWDLSSTYGRDYMEIGTEHSVNRPLLRDTGSSPSVFYCGSYTFSQWTNNADFGKSFDLGWSAPLSVALGMEWRRESYSLGAGDPASRYDFGPDGFLGYALSDAGTHGRRNLAAYVDLGTRLSPQWQINVAARAEKFSDFGNTVNGKLTSRYEVSPTFAVRGTVSNGFRAPTLQEEFYSATNVGPTYADVLLPTNSAAAALAGAKALEPEKSTNISVGIVATLAPRLNVTADFYQIAIRDRIIGSGVLQGAGPNAAIVAHGAVLDPSISGATVSYLTNGADTRSRGVDATATYSSNYGALGAVKWSAGLNLNRNTITAIHRPAGLSPAAASAIIEATPKAKLILGANYFNGDWTANLRATRYGATQLTVVDPDTGGAPYHTNRIAPATIVDIEAGYAVSSAFTLSAGVKNLFNRYPDKAVAQGYSHAFVLPSFSPFGINGAFYYVRGGYQF
ncbi:TonB-dependent receptor plug domain-containing protein [Pseudoduganella namucuonensis]|uniref:Iron complex outermembrane recepter protein n=1 Tax=Pseudoduganella namucuonensis TaxID=1035707 RepID=A0A1I7K182_9BURK|nr:TonB-dependent receptor [Pseudoduganella namucuonensis]SFU91218.1 iron complex outermembrane recepter protein [Pseudoduganella namucuonensis]